MTPYEINAICYKYSLITGIIFYLIYSICRYFGRKKAYKIIIDNLQEGEYIVYKPKFSLWLDIGAFGAGGFIGCFLLPFWLYDNIQFIIISGFKAVTRETLPLFVIIEIIVIIFVLAMSTLNVVLTNHRIIGLSALAFLNKSRRLNLQYLNIDSIVLKENILFPSFYILTKNGKKESLDYLITQKRIKQEIEQFLK